jgi:hypothetical protein
MKMPMTFFAVLAALAAFANVHAVEQWGLFETQFAGPADGASPMEVKFSATFAQGAQRVTVPGFWDGGGVFKVRFSPPTAGEWKFATKSEVAALDGKTGAFTATKAGGGNHGPVEMFDTFYLRHADGSAYHEFGTTCYAWVHQTEDLQGQTLKTLAASPFNKIRFCVFPKSYAYNQNEPEFFAFKKGADGKFDFAQPDPAFWRHFEKRILDLQKLGIEADLILWHPYDRWGFSEMSKAEDDRYLRYCIARLSAFRNVWWSLANEYDFMTDKPREKHRGNKQFADWDRFFSILEKEDPYHRLRGIHNGRVWYDHTKAWVTHASLQTSDMNAGVTYRAKYQKPVIYDECKYEGNVTQGWGRLTGHEMTQRFWLGTMSGCYVGHGETFTHPDDILWWSKGGVLHGESPQRIQWLKDFMAKSPPFHTLAPLGDDKGNFVLGKPGEYYLLYTLAGKVASLQLPGDRAWKVDAIDPWEMKEWAVGSAQPGEFKTAVARGDLAYRFTPYAPGEKLRPESRPTADVTEGVPPLTVKFASTGDARALWDFGDGATSTERNPSHVFDRPGIFPVTLTVTDSDGASARKALFIVVDRDSSAPILRAGFANDEAPSLQLRGTAKRKSDGTLHLPDGAPWGWVKAGDRPVEELRGLRSFTISGWVKPDSLTTGKGGNRILFCLQRDHSGIDLVCHNDGRLRLAVNQWPDRAKNDSSPGKLVTGKWTFFAVTYDSTKQTDNVAWYFSAPLDAPASKAEVKLDHRTTYNVGPVAPDIGSLAIGNFNETMQPSGLDRQLRGELRALQIFGSRVGSRGAFDFPAVQRLR